MSKVSIYGAGHPIQHIFSSSFVFTVPLFQRPYAWTTEQAGELLDDLLTFIDGGMKPIEELNPYFLGSIVLIKEEGESRSQIVDGQQRLTTLTILLAVLRKLLSSQPKYIDFIDPLNKFLYDKADPITNRPERFRLKLRKQDEEFFQNNIQREGGLDKLENLNPAKLSDSQKKIRENALLLLEGVKKLDGEMQIYLLRAVSTNCFLVEISTPDLDSAYRVFSVLNSRGLDLTHTDILKAEIIGTIELHEQGKYNSKWEEIEVELGRELFQNLFTYIRTIYRKVKSQDSILKEFRAYVRPTDKPQQFIDKVLKPYADAFFTIKNVCYESTKGAEQVNNLLKWLNQIDNSDWIPVAILYLSRNNNDPVLLLRFFADLERLAAGLMFLRANVNKRIERYSRLLTAIVNDNDLFAPNSPLQLTGGEQKDIIAYLDGDLYQFWFCKYVLLRLDEALADGEASFNFPIISIEHVLPQNPKADSTWVKYFPIQDEREKYVHRLGNLVLLSRKKNSVAQNYDFVLKKQKYFTTETDICPFPLTTQVIMEDEWTPFVIERRQQKLINWLKDIWRLS